MTKKTKGWEKRLTDYVMDCAQQKFKPGKLDCGLFFSGAIKVMTGEIIDQPFKGKYRTIEKAMDIAKGLGFENHAEYAASFFDELENPLMAKRGDGAVLDDIDGFPALGIVQGEYIYVMTVSDGITTYPLTAAKRAFSV